MFFFSFILTTIFNINFLSFADKREILSSSKQHPPEWQQLWYSNFEEFQKLTEPIFDNNTVSNMTVQLGSTAYLHCRVRNLGERTVSIYFFRSWFRMLWYSYLWLKFLFRSHITVLWSMRVKTKFVRAENRKWKENKESRVVVFFRYRCVLV